MKTMRTLLAALGCLCLLTTVLNAQVPNLLNDQGRVAVDGVNFDGQGPFKFALVNADGTAICWSNDGSAVPGSEPTASIAFNATCLERQIVLAIQEMQAAARQKYARRDPVQLQNYFFGERINPNEATLHQIAFTIAERLTPHTGTDLATADDKLPGITLAKVNQLRTLIVLPEWPISSSSSTGAIVPEEAFADRALRDALIREINDRRMEIQFAADAEWPYTDPLNIGARIAFRLPRHQPYTG